MIRRDHADDIESLAAEHCRSALELTEWFLERAAIREYQGGLSRADAERLAIDDVRAELEGRR